MNKDAHWLVGAVDLLAAIPLRVPPNLVRHSSIATCDMGITAHAPAVTAAALFAPLRNSA